MSIVTLCNSIGRQLINSVCRATRVPYEQRRNIVKLRRRFPTQIPNLGGEPLRFKKRHAVYVWEGDSMTDPQTKLKVILTENVDKIGNRGDIVNLRRRIARRHLSKGLAVYASPDNIKEFASERKELEKTGDHTSLTFTAQKTLNYLKKSKLVLKMRSQPHWDVLPREAIIHAFNKNLGVVIADHALELPEEPITTYGTYTVNVTINLTETVAVEMQVQKYLNKGRVRRLAQAGKRPDSAT